MYKWYRRIDLSQGPGTRTCRIFFVSLSLSISREQFSRKPLDFRLASDLAKNCGLERTARRVFVRRGGAKSRGRGPRQSRSLTHHQTRKSDRHAFQLVALRCLMLSSCRSRCARAGGLNDPALSRNPATLRPARYFKKLRCPLEPFKPSPTFITNSRASVLCFFRWCNPARQDPPSLRRDCSDRHAVIKRCPFLRDKQPVLFNHGKVSVNQIS